MRIALFVGNYSLGASVALINTCLAFAERGIRVDVFSFNNVLEDRVDFGNDHISLTVLTDEKKPAPAGMPGPAPALKRALKKILPDAAVRFIADRAARRLERGGVSALVPRRLVERSREIIGARKYTAFVGAEPYGLIWADLLGRSASVPLIYLSLELYVEGDPRFSGSYHGALRRYAGAAHQRAAATIIQDRERAERLARQDNVPISRFVFVPVAMKGDPVRAKSDLLYDLLHIPRDRKILIYIGLINEGRLSLETARAAAFLPDGWVMVLHGWCSSREYQDEIAALQGDKLYLSTDLVPFHRIADMISSAHVGISFYAPMGENELLTGAASSKTAQYLQCGLPVICNDFESIRTIVDEYRHGVCVASPSQIPGALDRICADYDGMRQRAFRCYQERYEITPHFERVIDILGQISDGEAISGPGAS